MADPAHRFLHRENGTHRKYEALRALFVEGVSIPEAAHRFGYAVGTVARHRTAFLRQPGVLSFLPDRRGKPKPSPVPDRDGRFAAFRKAENLSAAEIAERLTRQEKLPVSETTVARVLKRAGCAGAGRTSVAAGLRAPPSPTSGNWICVPGAFPPSLAACSCSPATLPRSVSIASWRRATCRAAP